MSHETPIDTTPRLLRVKLAAQLLPGTFEHAIDHLLEHAIDLSGFDARFRNDTTGAPAYPPAVLLRVVLKVVLCAYARESRGTAGGGHAGFCARALAYAANHDNGRNVSLHSTRASRSTA